MPTPAVGSRGSNALVALPFETVNQQTAMHLLRREAALRAANAFAAELVETVTAAAIGVTMGLPQTFLTDRFWWKLQLAFQVSLGVVDVTIKLSYQRGEVTENFDGL